MKLSDFLAQELAQEVKHVFVGNGGVVIHILDSLNRNKEITPIPMQTEQGAAIAAESYARLAGFGVAVATSGPGFVNLLQGIACAYYDSIPTLFIVGGVPRGHQRIDTCLRQFGFQEMDVLNAVAGITKRAERLDQACEIHTMLPRLLAIAKGDRPGPVLLEIPDDVQRETLYDRRPEPPCLMFRPPLYSMQTCAAEVEIMKAKRPLIIFGAGSRPAYEELKMLFTKLQIPFMPTWATKDMFRSTMTNYVPCGGISSSIAGNIIMQKADLIIALGTRLDTHQIGSKFSEFAPGARKIIVDLDAQELDKYPYEPKDIRIQAHTEDFIKALNFSPELKRQGAWKPWKDFCIKTKHKHAKLHKIEPYKQFQALSHRLQEGDIVITDAGATLTWTMQALNIRKEGIRLYSAFNHSPMGYALPAAIGAAFAKPDAHIISINGDGGFMMNIQELATVAFHGLDIEFYVVDNQGYGIIRQTQDTWLNGRHTCSSPGSGLACPDLQEIANAFDVTINIWKIPAKSKISPKLKWGQKLEEIT